MNDAFLAHNATWFDEINELSDVPADMWDEHAGMVVISFFSHYIRAICFLSLLFFCSILINMKIYSKMGYIHIYNLGLILARGRIDPAPEDRYNAESERYFDQFRYSRAAVPDSYSAVDAGFTFFSFVLLYHNVVN